jgi:signal peptidase II
MFSILFFILLILDQVIKWAARRQSQGLKRMISRLPGLGFQYRENHGFLLNSFEKIGPRFIAWIHGLIITGFSCFLLYFFDSEFGTIEKMGLMILYAGGVGNGIDRIFRGKVTDFIHLRRLKIVVNFADLYLVIGSAILIIGGMNK